MWVGVGRSGSIIMRDLTPPKSHNADRSNVKVESIRFSRAVIFLSEVFDMKTNTAVNILNEKRCRGHCNWSETVAVYVLNSLMNE